MSTVPAELRIPPRPSDAHKGDFGRVLLIAGSTRMRGAAILAGAACAKSGVGLLTIAVPKSIQATVAGTLPVAMTWPLPETNNGLLSLKARTALSSIISGFDCVAVGPGLGRSAGITALMVWLWNHHPGRLIFDADALNALSDAIRQNRLVFPPNDYQAVHRQAESRLRVLTPHVREFSRLLDAARDRRRRLHNETILSQEQLPSFAELHGERPTLERHATEIAEQLRAWILLKGPATWITDGHSGWRNSTGNPGMASGGSGDCLTGMLAAELAVTSSPQLAIRRACWAHGKAGDLAAAAHGEKAMNATDLVEFIPQAWEMMKEKQ